MSGLNLKVTIHPKGGGSICEGVGEKNIFLLSICFSSGLRLEEEGKSDNRVGHRLSCFV